MKTHIEHGKEGTRAFGLVRDVSEWWHPSEESAGSKPNRRNDPRFNLINGPALQKNLGKELRHMGNRWEG